MKNKPGAGQPETVPVEQTNTHKLEQPAAKLPEVDVKGDLVIGQVDKDAKAVIIGKNIISVLQNSSLTISNSWIALIIMSLITVVAVVTTIFIFAPELLPLGPKEMTGLFNIAVADFGEIEHCENPTRTSKDGEFLTEGFLERLDDKYDEMKVSDWVEIQPVDVIRDDEAAENLAQDINADIVIYGCLSLTRSEFIPKFYVSPHLSGAEEVTGPIAFGSPLEVHVPFAEHPENKVDLLDELYPRFEALTEFLFGLAFFKRDHFNSALQQFIYARDVEQWEDTDGKEILYLWIGTALHKRALQEDDEDTNCPITLNDQEINETETFAADGNLYCAWQAYTKAWLLNNNFARAQIGLGNLWLTQAKQAFEEQDFDFECEVYNNAVEAYRKALAMKDQPDLVYVDIKAQYNIGLAYANKYRHHKLVCPSESYQQAVDELNLTIALYQEKDNNDLPSLVHEIRANAYYHLGLVYKHAKEYPKALDALSQTIAIADPESPDQEDWRHIAWDAYNQMGHVYSEMAIREEDADYWLKALESYHKVIKSYKEKQYRNHTVASSAYFQAGLAYEALEDISQAKTNYEEALELIAQIPPGTKNGIEKRLQAISK